MSMTRVPSRREHHPVPVDDGPVAGNTRTSIRVAVADDSYLMRQAVGGVLDDGDGIDVVAACSDRDELLRAIDVEQPDVVVTDIRMPPTNTDEGLQVAAALRQTHPQLGVVVLTQFSNPSYGVALLDGGSDGRAYLLKEHVAHRAALVDAITEVAHGGSVIDGKVAEALAAERLRADQSPLARLTLRETEILALIARGDSNQAIADHLVLTKRAVEKHINSIFLKLGLKWAEHVSRRVLAALMYLADAQGADVPGDDEAQKRGSAVGSWRPRHTLADGATPSLGSLAGPSCIGSAVAPDRSLAPRTSSPPRGGR